MSSFSVDGAPAECEPYVAALRESEARYRTLVEHAPEAILVYDVDQERFVDANGNACALFRLSRDAMLQANPVQLSPVLQPDGRNSSLAAQEKLQEALAGRLPAFEWIHTSSDGVDLRCDVRLVKLPAQGRRLIGGSIVDVTRQRQLETYLRELQKLEPIGQLAGGIAHDFNNLLSIISSTAQLLVNAMPADDPRSADVDLIRWAAQRGSALTQQLLSVSRRTRSSHELIDLNAAVSEMTGVLNRVLGRDIRVLTDLDRHTTLLANRSQIEQILMNLLLNARDAMPGGGTITVSTSREADYRPPPGNPCRLRGRVVRLRVSDTGMGMDEDTLRRVFEPFFTTKPQGEGTGLGLTTVHSIVKQLGGCVEVESTTGIGTIVDIVVPSAEAAQALAA
jgi:PAS domain S-box-containing protein